MLAEVYDKGIFAMKRISKNHHDLRIENGKKSIPSPPKRRKKRWRSWLIRLGTASRLNATNAAFGLFPPTLSRKITLLLFLPTWSDR